MTPYDILILGAVSKDEIITPESATKMIGGAVVYSSIAINRFGLRIAALTKIHPADAFALNIFAKQGVELFHRESRQTTSIRNTYHSVDRERRTCEALGMADPFEVADLPEDLEAGLYYMGGLMRGEFPEAFVLAMAERGRIAIDAQGFLRVNEHGPMVFRDWPRKHEILPAVYYLKVDAAEAEILTGTNDIEQAAQLLHSWGPKEVVLTHNGGVLVCTEDGLCSAPFTSRNLSGRTGRGDTCFATYCAWRKDHTPEAACRFAAALTSLKMETPGPFAGTVQDVEQVIAERY